ncbi:PREDICTED: microtubule-associated tumor suppressor candidate 2-like [Priapulus caudatus]|uniref:Microtubule-associated tumor suppressor candidate 2-like n=1 Tax=Priapulus caudatus TaxID=37621 RepID=A0ABM1DU74_PRICU|nr:PREDICTED: microtubule-associated tumor suppressor candidate 2-like [Priapulus caudatus]
MCHGVMSHDSNSKLQRCGLTRSGPPDVLPGAQSRLTAAQQEVARLSVECEAKTGELGVMRSQLTHSTAAFDAMSVLVRYLTEQPMVMCHGVMSHDSNSKLQRCGLTRSGPPDVLPGAQSRLTAAQQEVARLSVECETKTGELGVMRSQLTHSTAAFDAMSVLVRYLTEQLDAFSNPQLVSELADVRQNLTDANNTICQLKVDQQQLQTTMTYLTEQNKLQLASLQSHHEEALQSLQEQLKESHCGEMSRVAEKHREEVEEVRAAARRAEEEKVAVYEGRIAELADAHSTYLSQLHEEQSSRVAELVESQKRDTAHTESQHDLVRQELMDELKEFELHFEALKQRSKDIEEALLKDTDTKIQIVLAKFKDLPAEVESLKMVVGMRNEEIRQLRTENNEIKKELEQLPIARDRILFLEQRNEDLKALVCITKENERQLTHDQIKLRTHFNKESQANKRLSMENEQLQWRLHQEPCDAVRRHSSRSGGSSPPAHDVTNGDGGDADVFMSPHTTPKNSRNSPTTPSSGRLLNQPLREKSPYSEHEEK